MTQDTGAADSETDEERCRRSLFLTDPEIDRQRLIDRKGERVPGTCEWILTDQTYQSWLRDDPGLLWICGCPGKGKTMMSIFITQTLERQNSDDIIYYFCNSEDDRSSTSAAILRALIWQIMAKRPELAHLVWPYFKSPERTPAVLSTPGTLFEIFAKLAKDPSMALMYCLIDGLDECEHDSVRWISSCLLDLYGETQMINLRVCIVSRDLPELRHARRILLDPDNNDKVDTDINNFTSMKMLDLTRRHNISHDLGLQIQTRLLQKSEGTFLWIGYAMNELLTKATVMQVLEALEELPVALPALYSRMIHKIAPDKLRMCTSILSWVALAERSLTVDELANAVGWPVPSQLTPDQAAQDYISLCKYLISIQGGKVILVHQSVKDYLLRTQPDDDRFLESARIKVAESHLAMADRCLKALESRSALVDYANLFWPEHAKQCGKLARRWIAKNDRFFGERSKSRKGWWQTYIQALTLEYYHGRLQLDPPQLHMACFLGLTQWVEDLLTSKRRFFKPWKRTRSLHHCEKDLATPLHFAVFGYNSETVDYLLEKGADPNSMFNGMGSPFQHTIRSLAMFSEGYDILEHMLVRGADVNIILPVAIDSGDINLLQIAIGNGASVNMYMYDEKARDKLTSLHRVLAAWDSDNAIPMIRRLLGAGADPSIKDSNGKTAIQYAYCDPDIMTQMVDDRRQKLYEEKMLAMRDLLLPYIRI
jgi:hypothetical protein